MVTWQELNEKLNKIDWSGTNSGKEFNATTCNEIAHDAIMKRERSLVVNLIKNAAEGVVSAQFYLNVILILLNG